MDDYFTKPIQMAVIRQIVEISETRGKVIASVVLELCVNSGETALRPIHDAHVA